MPFVICFLELLAVLRPDEGRRIPVNGFVVNPFEFFICFELAFDADDSFDFEDARELFCRFKCDVMYDFLFLFEIFLFDFLFFVRFLFGFFCPDV